MISFCVTYYYVAVTKMDYLDPKKKKAKRIRLMIMYALLGIAISIATVVFVFLANGYYIDRKTGDVIQNGLIYIDSKPESATIHLNGVQQRGSTDARLVVPEGTYDIELRRDGYFAWKRNLRLEGGSLRRLTYARLIPEILDSEQALTFPSMPTAVSQSNDKRWMVAAFDDKPLVMQAVDLNSATPQLVEVPLPLDIITQKPGGTWKFIEWADDHRTFLASYSSSSGAEYVLIDRTNPAAAINVTKTFAAQKVTAVSMRNRKNDQQFLYAADGGVLYKANAKTGEITEYLRGVTDYTAYGDDAVLYVTEKDAKAGTVKAILRKGDKDYTLREIKKDSKYLLEMAKLGNSLVMGIGSAAEGRVLVYDDPIHALSQNDFSTIPVPTTVLKVDSPQELTISADSSVILARSGKNYASHEFEEDRTYVFTLDPEVSATQEIRWMDGRHFMIGSDDSKQYISDYDGSNLHQLSSSQPGLGSIFDAPIDRQFTFQSASADAPQPKMMRTFMRAKKDR